MFAKLLTCFGVHDLLGHRDQFRSPEMPNFTDSNVDDNSDV